MNEKTGAGTSPGCSAELIVIDGPAVEARRRTGLQPSGPERQVTQTRRQGIRRRLARPAALVAGFAHVDPAGQERARRQHHAGSVKTQARLRHYALDAVAFDNQVIHSLLEQVQVVRLFQQGPDDPFVQVAINLRPGGPYRRTLAGIEDTELYPAPVRSPGHDPAQGVYFLDQVAFADAADGRIARHLPQGIDTVGQQQGTHTHARGGQGSLCAGMAPADDDYVVFLFTGAHISPGFEMNHKGVNCNTNSDLSCCRIGIIMHVLQHLSWFLEITPYGVPCQVVDLVN